jgi:hypothetical protein
MVTLEVVEQLQPILKVVDATVEYCDEIDAERAWDDRAYAHVDHHDSVICVAHAFDELPAEFQAGILLHEVGHLLDDGDTEPSEHEMEKAMQVYDPERVAEEAAANHQVADVLGIEIDYECLACVEQGRGQLQRVDMAQLQRLLA